MNHLIDIKKLSEEGFFIFNNFFSKIEIDQLYNSSHFLLKKFENNENFIDQNLKIAIGNETVQELDSSEHVVLADRRKNKIDNGMIDIFNPQKVNSKESNIFNLFRKKIKSEFIPILEKNYLKKFTLEATNIYQHYKTTNPRKAHYDNEDNYFKLFLFLSDVKDNAGSFFFYKFSHNQKLRKKLMNRINKFFFKNNKLEDKNFIFNDKFKINLTGNIGTTVITDVSGLHGCNPFNLDDDKKRLVLVQRIAPII